jgi:hypothetical protein
LLPPTPLAVVPLGWKWILSQIFSAVIRLGQRLTVHILFGSSGCLTVSEPAQGSRACFRLFSSATIRYSPVRIKSVRCCLCDGFDEIDFIFVHRSHRERARCNGCISYDMLIRLLHLASPTVSSMAGRKSYRSMARQSISVVIFIQTQLGEKDSRQLGMSRLVGNLIFTI